MRRSLLIAAVVLSASGCHTFQPVPVSELTPGEAVRARVTGAFSDSLSPILAGDARVIEGSYVESNGSTVYLDVPVSSAYQGMRLQTLNQRIEVPVAAFVEMERKQLSKERTGLAVGSAVVAAAALVISQLSGEAGGGVRPGGGGPVDAVVSAPSASLVSALSWLWSR